MRAIGDVQVIGADTSFLNEPPTPALPGAKSAFAESSPASPRRSTSEDVLQSRIQASMELMLGNARRQVERVRSSTTLASLAQVLEASGESMEAISTAAEALSLCTRDETGRLLDASAVRIALEVLVRLGQLDKAVAYARQLPLDPHTKLIVGTAVAGSGDFERAHAFIDDAQVEDRDTVLGYLLVSEGNDGAAIPILRSALRRSPHDADIAHNLSIALWRHGSRRKAIAAALQATRSAPGRKDAALHYLELLLEDRQFGRAEQEVALILDRGVEPTSRLLITQARAQLGLGHFRRAERLLSDAGKLALAEGDRETFPEVRSNLIRLRVVHDKLSNDDAIKQMLKLHAEYTDADVVVANLAQVSVRRRHAAALRNAFQRVSGHTSVGRAAFIEYQLATLEGENELAIDHSLKWLEAEPENSYATSAAMVALGIGAERWSEAASIAEAFLERGFDDPVTLNNAAYVLAMSGKASRAIELLRPHAADDFVLKATLGLAYLASNQIDLGMKMYREAAVVADRQGDEYRSLMTNFQALVVRQLGLLDTNDPKIIAALSLPPVELPEDWRDQPEFLRVHRVAVANGYPWPLSI